MLGKMLRGTYISFSSSFRRSPISVAAAAIYMASQASDEKRSQKGIWYAIICFCLQIPAMSMFTLQWNLYQADTFGTFPSVRLIEVVKIAQCLLMINFQRLLCTVIKLRVVKEAIQSSSSLPFITKFNLFVTEKTLTDFSPYFKDVIRYYYCQFSPCPLNRGF